MSDHEVQLSRIVAAQFRRRLCDEQLPRLQRCLRLLGDQRVWTRPGRTGNSAANLVLHLCGNTTQWIIAQFDGEPDRRQRDQEFAADGGQSAEQLCAALERVYRRACDVVDSVDVATLLAPRTVQGYVETGLSAILHVLEHTSGHAGQIYAWTKQLADVDLAFYDL